MFRRDRPLPFIPKPEKKEEPVVEELVTPVHMHHDMRPVMRKPHTVREARLNRLYGAKRVENSWRWEINQQVSGTLTTIAATQVTTAIKLANDPFWRLGQWPGGVQLFLVLRQFSICPQASLTTAGDIVCSYQDGIGGSTVPLGIFPSTAGANSALEIILSSPITDPDRLVLGNLLVTLNGSSPTVGTYDFQIAFSEAYLLPELRGYEREYTEVRWEHEKSHLYS